MTNGRGVDLDLLADYIGGALDGTPQAATVERLVADDPAWSRAYAETSAAMESVRVDLGALGAAADQMPAGVLGRLEAVLTPVLPEENATVVPLAPRRRWVRRLAPVAVAAGVLACVGLGVAVLQPDSARQDAATSSGGGAADSGPAPAMAQPEMSAGRLAPKVAPGGGNSAAESGDRAAGPPILASGTDYTRDTVAGLTTATFFAMTKAPQSLDGTVPQQLRRLTDPAALSACLFAIKGAYAQPAATVRLVDLARFEGSPAVVVLLPDSIWVSGADCGLTGPDARYSTRTQGR